MSHDISEITVDGKNIVEAMYANKPAWHGLGTIFDDNGASAPDSDTAMKLAHLEWAVERQPMFLKEASEPLDGHWAVVRTDTQDVLGVVGDRYKCFQNSEAFSFLDSLLQDGIMRYESAMALNGGKRVALLARMPSVDLVTANDPLMRYVLLSTSHDGSSAIQIQATSIRVVCANTLAMALGESGKNRFSFKHTANAGGALAKARWAISQYDKAFTEYGEQAKHLLEKPMVKTEVQSFLDELFPTPEDATDRMKAGIAKKIAAVRDGYATTIEVTPETKGNWWGMFNAVTQAIDHHDTFNNFRGDARKKHEAKFLSITEGTYSELKAKAFELALSI